MPTKEELIRQIRALDEEQPWNHNIRMTPDVQTRPGSWKSYGKNERKWERIEPLIRQFRVAGKSVLDVGCNEGFFCLKLAEQGAETLGIDVDELRIRKAEFVKSTLGSRNVNYRALDIYSAEFDALPMFDLCLCLGFLHRVPDPFTVVARLASRANIIIFEWKALKHGPYWDSIARFTPGAYRQDDYYGTQFWLLSFQCLEEMLRRVGYSYFRRIDDPAQTRAIMVAGKIQNAVLDEGDQIAQRGRTRVFLRHTKAYLSALGKIFSGEANA